MGTHHSPAARPQAIERRGAGDRDLHRDGGSSRQLDEARELDVLAPVPNAVDHRQAHVGLPRHHRREPAGVGIEGKRPALEHDRLARGDPGEAAVRNGAVGLADVLGEGEEAVVLADEGHRERFVVGGLAAFLSQELCLGIARIRVEVGGAFGATVLVAEPARAGDVEEEVGRPAETRDRLPAGAVEGAVRNPHGEAFGRHGDGVERVDEPADVAVGVVGERLSCRVVEPLARVLEVEHVATQPAKSVHVGQIVPRHSAQGKARNQAGHHDPHRRTAMPKGCHESRRRQPGTISRRSCPCDVPTLGSPRERPRTSRSARSSSRQARIAWYQPTPSCLNLSARRSGGRLTVQRRRLTVQRWPSIGWAASRRAPSLTVPHQPWRQACRFALHGQAQVNRDPLEHAHHGCRFLLRLED